MLFGLSYVPVVDEPVEAGLKPEGGVGKSLSLADQVGDTLAQCVVGAFDY